MSQWGGVHQHQYYVKVVGDHDHIVHKGIPLEHNKFKFIEFETNNLPGTKGSVVQFNWGKGIWYNDDQKLEADTSVLTFINSGNMSQMSHISFLKLPNE